MSPRHAVPHPHLDPPTSMAGRRWRPLVVALAVLLMASLMPATAARSETAGAEPHVPTIEALVAGHQHSCGLDERGVAWCWGDNNRGQLGDPDTAQSFQRNPLPVAVHVPGDVPFVQLAAGDRHTCGLVADGSAWCWGDNGSGQLGNLASHGDTVNPVPAPVQLPQGVRLVQVAAGTQYTCGVDSVGGGWCWGHNQKGQIGTPANVGGSINTPVAVRGLPEGTVLLEVTAGDGHTCARGDGGTVWCWGRNDVGQLGDPSAPGDVHAHPTPSVVAGLPAAGPTTLGASLLDTCAGFDDATVWCWGNTGTAVSTPVAGLPDGVAVQQVAAGGRHTCAVLADASLWCWGYNDHGQLGQGGGGIHTTAVRVTEPAGGYRHIAAGLRHTCGLPVGDAVLCWGDNDWGQTGTRPGIVGDHRPWHVVDLIIQGTDARGVAGRPATLVSSASGDLPMAYQWSRDGVDLEGETGLTLTVIPTADERGDGHRYTLTARNGFFSTFVRPTLFVAANVPPEIAADQSTVEVDAGAVAAATGTWWDDGPGVTMVADRGDVVHDAAAGTWTWTGSDTAGAVTITIDDGDGEQATVSFDVIVNEEVAPDLRLRQVREQLAELRPTGDARDDRRIGNAIDHLDESLDEDYWEDDGDADVDEGTDVLDELRHAVKQLAKVDDTDVAAAIDEVTTIARLLAQAAIDEARAAVEASDADAKSRDKALRDLEKAVEQVADGDARRGDGDHDKAVRAHRKAVEHAAKAVEHVTDDDADDDDSDEDDSDEDDSDDD